MCKEKKKRRKMKENGKIKIKNVCQRGKITGKGISLEIILFKKLGKKIVIFRRGIVWYGTVWYGIV
jgi:hypothetical protein